MRKRKPVPGDKSMPDRKVDGEVAPHRADRPAYKRGGSVKSKGGATVNVVIASPAGAPGMPATPMMPPAGLAPARPAMAGPPPNVVPGAGPGISAAVPMTARPPGMATGGRVTMTAGAGGGLGRIQKSRNQ